MSEWLVRGYFALNALLYAGIALRTTLNPDAASTTTGFAFDSAGARSEYLVSYAGLLFALAGMFVLFAVDPGAQRIGLKVAIVFYLPIIIYRIVPALVAGNRYAFSAGATSIEIVLLVGAIALLILSAPTRGSDLP